MLRRPMPWFRRCLFVLLGLAFAAVSCDSDGQAPSTPTDAVPPVTTPEVAREGDRHGGFLFTTDRTVIAANPKTPRPIPTVELEEAIPFQHPGLHQFDTPEQMAAFVDGRTVVLAPPSAPPGSVLLGAWAIELASGEISDTGIGYRFSDTESQITDPDIWIASGGRLPYPITYDPNEEPLPSGQVRRAIVKTTVFGYPAVYLPIDNPSDIHIQLQFPSALSWFDDRGWFWSIQGRNMSLDELQAIAASLMELTPAE